MSLTASPARGAVLQVKIGTVYTTIAGLDEIPEIGGEKSVYETAYINSTLPTVTTDLLTLDEITINFDVDLKNDTAQAHLLASYNTNPVPADDFKVLFTSGANSTWSGKVTAFKVSAKGGANERGMAKIKRTTDVTHTPAS